MPQRTFFPGSEWLYYKLYCGETIADDVLSNTIRPFVDKMFSNGLIDKWFYIRYYDPEHHLRIRMKAVNDRSIGPILASFNEVLKLLYSNNVIWNVKMDTYQREIERYGPDNISLCEDIFNKESSLILEFLSLGPSHGQQFQFAAQTVQFYIDKMVGGLPNDLEFHFGWILDGFKKEFSPTKQNLRAMRERIKTLTLEEVPINNVQGDLGPFLDRLHNPYKLCWPLAHMFVNRLFYSNQREIEYLVYYHLYKKNNKK